MSRHTALAAQRSALSGVAARPAHEPAAESEPVGYRRE
jgi:hypothetical protein